MHRCALLVVLAGCRLHFDELPADAPSDAPVDAAPLQLACNTPVRIADAPPTAPRVEVTAIGPRALATWIDASGGTGGERVDFVAPDTVFVTAATSPATTGYELFSAAAAGSAIVAAYTVNGVPWIEQLDRDANVVHPALSSPVAILGPRAVASTGSASGTIAAVSGHDEMTMRGEVVPVHDDGTLGTPVDTSTLATASSIVDVGDRLAVARSTTANACVISTLDLAVTSHGTSAGWGTAGQCTQAAIGYSPGRRDALLVRHDMIDGDLNHVIATRNGDAYTIPGESRLRNPGNEPRPIGVADGYWVSYETGGTLEAAHVDVLGAVGTVVPLGPLGTTTAHDTFVVNGEPYAAWVQDGLEIARLCE